MTKKEVVCELDRCLNQVSTVYYGGGFLLLLLEAWIESGCFKGRKARRNFFWSEEIESKRITSKMVKW